MVVLLTLEAHKISFQPNQTGSNGTSKFSLQRIALNWHLEGGISHKRRTFDGKMVSDYIKSSSLPLQFRNNTFFVSYLS